jgi:hypothetical protein
LRRKNPAGIFRAFFLFQIPEAFGQKKERGTLGGGKEMGGTGVRQ